MMNQRKKKKKEKHGQGKSRKDGRKGWREEEEEGKIADLPDLAHQFM